MESVKRAKARLGAYPSYLVACAPEGSTYAKCVSNYMGEVQKNQCQTEFVAFKQCIQNQAKRVGKKL